MSVSLMELPLTMTDAAQPSLFRSVKGSRKGSIHPVACALIVEPTNAVPVTTVRLSWSELLAARLRGIAKLAADSGEPQGKSLPYASLRAALQAQIPEAVLLARDLGAPWKREDRFPFLDVQASFEPARDPVRLAASALKTWMTMVLKPWADQVGIDDDLMDAVQDLATPDDAFAVEVLDVDLSERIRAGDSFDRLKHGILQVIAQRLEGQELFDGLGPVYRVVRGSSAGNEISFQTWPATASSGGRYSMVASLTVETGPFIGKPVVTIRASRRRWYDALPEPKRLYRLRTLTGTIMGKGKSPVAVEFTTPVHKGVPAEPFSPEFMIQALNVRQDLAAGLADMVARQGAQGIFVGVPYSPQLGGKHPVGGGATTRDHIDLFDVVAGLLETDGFQPLPFRQTEENKKNPKRAEEQHKALQAEALIADIALSLGRNHLDGDALLDACRRLMSEGDVPDIKADTALKARSALEELRAANQDRVRRAFGVTKPVVAVLARTDRERAVMRACIHGLFGRAVDFVEYQLPVNVHGARADLPRAEAKAKERFAARVEAWSPLARVIEAEQHGCHALVQAAEWYDKRKDDPVNKLAGRYALASRADANVQYLRPPEAGWRGLANYLHRIQAGVYDLLFGHSGLVSEINSLLKGAFPKEASRPKAIIGISVVSQARLRYGASGGRLCLATRVDTETGRTSARVGWFDGVMRWSPQWEPFFEALKRIASPDITASLGDTRNVERDSFQKFVKTVVDESAQAGDRPLVLIDSTSAAGLWTWLTDAGIGDTIALGNERVDMAVRWPGVRVVRVRTGRAGRVVERKTSRYERVDAATGQPTGAFVDRYCPSITERTIRLADGPDGRSAHYWVTAGYFQMSIPRGLSVYRNLASFFPAKKEKDLALPPGVTAKGLYTEHTFDIAKALYRLPNAIDVTVACALEEDDPDRITHMVASLRYGYGHTKDTTTLPAPLSFESKARDYMTRFALDEADAEDVLDADDDGGFEAEDDPGDDGGDDAPIDPAAPDVGSEEPPAGTPGGGEPQDDDPGDGDGPGGGSSRPKGPPQGGGGSCVAEARAPSATSLGSATMVMGRPSMASAKPQDAWDVLLSQFGVGRAVSTRGALTTATSLTGSSSLKTPFGPPSRPSFLTSQPHAASPRDTVADEPPEPTENPAGGAADTSNDGNSAQEEEGEMTKSGSQTGLWPDLARKPVLPLPPFVTRDWLAPKVSAPASVIRIIHTWRQEVRELSGFPWPKEKPSPEAFLDLMLDGLRYPGFFRAVMRVVARSLKTPKKREDYNLFNPFRRIVGTTLSGELKKTKRKPTGDLVDDMRVLIDAGHVEMAKINIYLYILLVGHKDRYLDFVHEFEDKLSDLLPFFEAVKEHMNGGFNWRADIIEQRGAPITPPCGDDGSEDGVPQEPSDGDGCFEASMDDANGTVAGEGDATGQDAGEQNEGIRVSSTTQTAEGAVTTAVEQSSPETAGRAVSETVMQAANARTLDHPGHTQDPVAVYQTEWARNMTEAARLASAAAAGEPDLSALDGLIAKLDMARAAARAWEDAKPKHVDPAPLLEDARALASALAEMAKQEAPVLETVPLVTPEAAEAADAVLVEARSATEQARDLLEQAKAVATDFERIEEAAELKVQSRDVARSGLEALSRFSAALNAGAVSTATPAVQALTMASEGLVGTAATVEETAAPSSPEAPAVHAAGEWGMGEAELAASVVASVPMEAVHAPVVHDNPADLSATAGDLPTGVETKPLEADVHVAGAETTEVVAAAEATLDDAALDLLMEVAAAEESGGGEAVEAFSAADALGDENLVNGSLEEEAGPADPGVGDEDSLAMAVERKLSTLFEAREFGLAYHLLRAGSRVFPERDFAFAAPEFRLCAMAGHVNHAALQGNAGLNRLLEEVLTSVQALQADPSAVPEDVASARRIMLFGATAVFALFHADSVASQILEALNGTAPGVGEGLYPLKDALMNASRSGVGLTPAMLRTVSRAAEEDRYSNECLKAIRAKVEMFAQLRFRFQLGNKIRQTLTRSDGVIGKLKERLDKGDKVALEAAREFAEAYADRGAIITLLEDAEVASNNFKFQGVDGDARERLVANIADLSALCHEYVQACDAAPAMNKAGQRAIVQGIRTTVLAGLAQARTTLESYHPVAAPLPAAAAAYTLRMLERLAAAIDGQLPSTGTTDHLLALHGPLLWLPGLHFGRSWLPSPYQPEIVVGTILAAATPSVPRNRDRFAALETAVRARLDQDSFVAARLLAEGGAHYGANEAQRGQLRDLIEGNVQTRRDKLTGDIAEVRRMVDRVQRMGMLRGVDDAQSLLSLLDRLDPDALPTDVAMDARDEDEESELILDFASAEAALDDVRHRVQRLLDKPRLDLLARLDALAASGRVSQEDADRVRGIADKDDLLTAGEYMGFLEDGRALPETSSPNPRFRAFFPAVTEALEKLPKRELEAVRESIEEGRDLGPLAYSSVPENRREDALELLDQWKELRSRVQGGFMVDHVITLLVHFLDHAGLKTELTRIDTALSNAKRKVYVAEMRLRIPTDAESVLLPDFGSQTGGNYRVCIVAKMPSESELTSLWANANSMGVIVLVASPVDAERRRQLAWHSVDQSRRVLVIDEAIFLFALSEPEFRPLTMIECAQPFSFAAPYRDYGNQAVPPEMFFGRAIEYRKLLDASGSCIVYGGRRLGKTALLQHIKATQHDPENGMAVAYVGILAIGNNVLPSHIWEYASRDLPALFPEPVSTAADFTAKVKAWLDADTRRRVLMLFDESDRFIEADADDGFREFIRLQALMDTTNRRFKFVLAGLHNVTRLVHTENPPLKQIASDPQRIGPLMDEELEDAELLVTQPLAAMGYEFENREDVWRILSHCNYYPVLVQTFCKGLLEDLAKEVVRKKKPITVITGEHVRAALEDEKIAREIGKMFDYTISEIEDRYALIANIMAERALEDSAAGRVGEGMSAVDVLDAASTYWPAAFKQVNRLSVVEDLLDEMEGLGVLRRVGADTWSLRSHAILRLLGNEAKIMAKLIEFMDRPAPAAFEPRSMRRPLHLPAIYKVPQGHLCPLTLGQEHDLLTRDAPGQVPVHVRAIFGNGLADLSSVAAAMRTAGPLVSDGTRVEVVAQAWPSAGDLLDAVRQARPKEADLTLIVVDSKSDWDGSWLEQPLRSKPVRDGRVRLAVVGGPQHALRWVTDLRLQPLPPQVRVMPLQPWSTAMVDHYLLSNDLSPEQYREPLRKLLGGFNRPMSQMLGSSVGPRDKFLARLEKQQEKLLADKALWADLGLVAPMDAVFRRFLSWVDADGRITAYEIAEGILPNVDAAQHLTGQQVVEYGTLMGLLEPEPLTPGVSEDGRRYTLNPLLAAALEAARSLEAV